MLPEILHCNVVGSPLNVKDTSNADDSKENTWTWNKDSITAAIKLSSRETITFVTAATWGHFSKEFCNPVETSQTQMLPSRMPSRIRPSAFDHAMQLAAATTASGAESEQKRPMA